jgi:hypothetical protein
VDNLRDPDDVRLTDADKEREANTDPKSEVEDDDIDWTDDIHYRELGGGD